MKSSQTINNKCELDMSAVKIDRLINMYNLLPILFVLLLSNFSFGQEYVYLSESETKLVLSKVYMFDFETNDFKDIDEMYIEELWLDNKENAIQLFDKAIRLTFAPLHERMILASYFYHDNEPKYVYWILNDCKTTNDSIAVFRVMDSYSIKYSDFKIDHDKLRRYCETCTYR